MADDSKNELTRQQMAARIAELEAGLQKAERSDSKSRKRAASRFTA